MPFAFVLDENLRGPLWQAVRRREMRGDDWLDVTCVVEVAELPLGSDDLAVIRWAERTGRLLVTLDRGTMAKHLQTHLASGSHSPGVLLVRPRASVRSLLEMLELIAQAGDEIEFSDTVTFIP